CPAPRDSAPLNPFERQASPAPSIYVVDDEAQLTGLYTVLLEAEGYIVTSFNDRAEALAALRAQRAAPDLLISDYSGLSMPVDEFLQQCLAIHPGLKILMVSGFNETNMHFDQARPDRFIEKPFAIEEFTQEISGMLASRDPFQRSSRL